MKEITIDGKTVSVEEAQAIIGLPVALAEIHAGVCGNLAEAENEVTRTHQAASVCTANAVVIVGRLVLAHLEAGLGDAVLPELTLLNALGKTHLKHWDDFELCRDGTPPALPDDLEARLATLDDKLAVLDIRITNVVANIASMALGHEDKPSIDAVLDTLNAIRKGASESVDGACGRTKIEISDAQLKLNVDGLMQRLVVLAGKSEEEALAIIDEKLGATDDEKKATIAKLYIEQLALDKEGTKNGSLLSAETEITVATAAADSLEAMISG